MHGGHNIMLFGLESELWRIVWKFVMNGILYRKYKVKAITQ